MKRTILLILCTFLLCTAISFAADDDGDGIDSTIEIANGTDPDDADTDNDLILDGEEDMDQDGIVDIFETDPLDADTDDDGISDGEETIFMLSNLNPDSDGDELTDGQELGRSYGVPGGMNEAGILFEGTAESWIWDFDPTTQTDPLDQDTDGDGLIDGMEDRDHRGVVFPYATSPGDADSDDDGLSDGEEDVDQNGFVSFNETDPLENDSDDDNLNDGLEKGRSIGIMEGYSNGSYYTRVYYRATFFVWFGDQDPSTETDPKDPDTDEDGIADGIEDVNHDGRMDANESGPDDADTDDDGIDDGSELFSSLNPLNWDTDNDGLNDGQEKGETIGRPEGISITGVFYSGTNLTWMPDSDPSTRTDPDDNDTDNDGVLDGTEDINRNGSAEATETKPEDADHDDDGLNDGEEDLNLNGIFDPNETDPKNSDSDNDGLTDGLEQGKGSPVSGGTSNGIYVLNRVDFTGTATGWTPDFQSSSTTNPLDNDSDNDGLSDGTEDADHDGIKDLSETDPNNADTDGDGINDLIEGLAADTDSDGFINALDPDDDGDGIPTITEGSATNTDGDSYPDYLDTDSDNDGIPDITEGSSDSPLDSDAIPNYRDTDSDGDGKTDADEGGTSDSDGDEMLNFLDMDSDNDGIPDSADNCYLTYNPSQEDNDDDLVGNLCDPDDDDDGSPDVNDCAPLNPSIYPGAVDIPDDGIDQDCNGFDATICYVDEDKDGYGNTFGYTVIAEDGACDAGQEESVTDNDCNDNDLLFHPGAIENCNDPDYNCDGETHESSSATLVVTACESYTAPDDQIYTTSGIKTAVVPNAAGCDSTITINLTITNSTESSITIRECESYTAPDDQIYTTSGIKTAVIPNAAGCDSTITINLEILQSESGNIFETACKSFEWNGTTYTASGDYTFNTTSAQGCDSIAYLHLTIHPIPATPSISQTGIMLYSDSPTGNQWYDQNGPLEGATGDEFSGSTGNSYYVIVVIDNCSSVQSNSIHLIETGYDSKKLVEKYEIYPNPVSDVLNIKTTGNDPNIMVEIMNTTGTVIYSERFVDETAINTSEFAPGIYLIKLENENNNEFIKIIKK